MKKSLLLLLAAILVCLCASAASAQVDLQVRNAYIYKFTDPNSDYQVEFLRVVVQNNGPDDFVGQFYISASDGSKRGSQDFVGVIKSRHTVDISVVGSPTLSPYSFFIDPEGKVEETDEGNNYFYFDRDEPQVAIIDSWTGLKLKSQDTLYVLPGEYLYSQFSLTDFGKESIIGIRYEIFSYNFVGESNLDFGVQIASDNNFHDGTYSYRGTNYYYDQGCNYPKTTFSWMANSSEAAVDYWRLGNFSGENSVPVGEVRDIYLFANVAVSLSDKTTASSWLNLSRSIKTIDRIRGDVNDDGVVNQEDVNILVDVVTDNSYNPCIPSPGIYQERGLNYGAGIVLFSRPDLVSNCLLNIWVHDKNDPLVQGLGIGEMMSSRFQSAIEKVANTFTMSGSELLISAPGADIYNVSAVQKDGQLFQKTGRMGEEIAIPDPDLRYSVETVRLNSSQAVTRLFAPTSNKDLVVVRSTKIEDAVEVSGSGQVTIVNLGGQEMFSGRIQDENLTIPSAAWPAGMYVLTATSDKGRQAIKLVK